MSDDHSDDKIEEMDTGPLPATTSAHALRRPFYFAGGSTGVLLVHGFTGSPYEMRLLGEALAARGLTVYGPRLAGHGQSLEAMASATSADWVRSVDEAFTWLRARTERVAVCGLSLGGLLTLELARRRPTEIAAIEVLSSPLWLAPAVEILIRGTSALTQRFGRIPELAIPKWAGSDIADPQTRPRNNLAQGALGIPLSSVLQLRAFMSEVRALLPEVRVPALLMHSRLDHTAPYDCMAAIAGALGTREITMRSLERSFHVVTLDVERDQVIDAVDSHIRAHTEHHT